MGREGPGVLGSGEAGGSELQGSLGNWLKSKPECRGAEVYSALGCQE